MKKINRFLILAVLIIAAFSCHIYGNSTGTFVFIVLGCLFEGLFWFGLFRKSEISSS